MTEHRKVSSANPDPREIEAMKARRRGQPAPLARLDIQGLPDTLP